MSWSISGFWSRVEGSLFPELQERLPEMQESHRRLVVVLEIVRVEAFAEHLNWQRLGRRRKDRAALARSFVAKAAYNMPTTEALMDRLRVDATLRRLCGWEQRRQIPSKSTFSRAFAVLAATGLLDTVHGALVERYVGEDLFHHVSTDATEIEARERPVARAAEVASGGVQASSESGEAERAHPSGSPAGGRAAKKGRPAQALVPKPKRGRPRKGEERSKQDAKPNRIERQLTQTAEEALSELPKACDVGAKRNSKGHQETWVGYKFHVSVGDGGLPLAAATTSASLHDSQVAVPLMGLTAGRVTSLYDLMDSAYDAQAIRGFSRQLGHVPIIDHNPRGAGKAAYMPMDPDRAERYKNRTASERFNSRLKDDCGGRMVRVRGHDKVHAHLMFGLLVVFAEALLNLLP